MQYSPAHDNRANTRTAGVPAGSDEQSKPINAKNKAVLNSSNQSKQYSYFFLPPKSQI